MKRGYNKFKAKPTECSAGHLHASIKESVRCNDLTQLEAVGQITHLEQQPSYDVIINGKKVCGYVADFRYRMTDSGLVIVEDVKGVQTRVFQLKKKLVEAAHPGTVIAIYPPKVRKKRKSKKAA